MYESIGTSWKANSILINVRKPLQREKEQKKNHRFNCASSWNRAVCFIDLNFSLYRFRLEMSCYRFPKYLLETKVLFVSHRFMHKCSVFIIPPCFCLLRLSSHVTWKRCREWNIKKKTAIHKQKQCIENGSLWRAFNRLISIVYIHRFLYAEHWNGFFLSLSFSLSFAHFLYQVYKTSNSSNHHHPHICTA